MSNSPSAKFDRMVRVDPQLYDRLTEYADQEGKFLKRVVSEAVRLYLATKQFPIDPPVPALRLTDPPAEYSTDK